MTLRRNPRVNIDFAVGERVCWQCALSLSRRYSSLPHSALTPLERYEEFKASTADVSAKVPEGILNGWVPEYTQMFRKNGPFAPRIRHLASLPIKRRVSRPVRSLHKSTSPRGTLVSTLMETKGVASLSYIPRFTTRRKFQLSFHTSNGRSYATRATGNAISDVQTSDLASSGSVGQISPRSKTEIRDHLIFWQEHLKRNADQTTQFKTKTSTFGAVHNNFSVSGEDDNLLKIDRDDGTLDNEPNRIMLSADDFFGLADDNFFLRPGDVVELYHNGEPILAVFIQTFNKQSQFYTMYGKWVHQTARRILFAIQQMVPAEDLSPIIAYLPKDDIPSERLDRLHSMDINVPREAGAGIIQKLLKFYRSTNETIRSCASKLKRIHDLVALPAERSYASLQEIAMRVMQKDKPTSLTDSMLWAVHRSISQNTYFRPHGRNHRLYPLWDIISKSDATSLERVRNWLREYQERITNEAVGVQLTDPPKLNPFPEFINKARALVQESRKTRMLTYSGCIGPSVVRVKPTPPDWAVWREEPSVTFTSQESQIIQFLHAWASTDNIRTNSVLSSIGSLIIRATKMYKGFELGKSTGFLFLQELGTVPPWLNRSSFAPILPLPSHGVDALTDRLHREANNSTAGFQIEDSMKDLRKDWGDLQVFCIDDAEATEIDDGISLEQVDGSASTFWVHVHVANPSAFLAPGSPMGLYAAHSLQTVYFPERVYPLLPQKITQTRFSLGKDRPCITFSAKITTAGDVIDTDISHGILHNVTYVTPETLRRELGFEQVGESQGFKMTIGGKIPAKPTRSKSPQLLPTQLRLLHKLCDLAVAIRQKKEQEGAISYQSQLIAAEVGVYLGQTDKSTSTNLNRTRSSRFEGDPIITLRAKVPNSPVSSDELVQQMMKLAGEIGASWCAKRNIPIAYRGTALRPDPPESPEQFKKDHLDPFLSKNVNIPIGVIHQYARLLGKTVVSPVPLRHIIIGSAAYARVTSPLRRFADMMAHWQIEAAIRRESRTGSSLIGSTDDSYLPFSRPDADSMIRRISVREAIISGEADYARRHWVQQFLVRAFLFKEASFPETFKLHIISETNVSMDYHTGWMKELGIAFDMPENHVTEREGGVRTGDCWEVKITLIDCYKRTTTTEAIRLIERTNNLGDE